MAELKILLQSGAQVQVPAVTQDVALVWERKRTPGKLTFTVVKDEALNFQEGDAVKLLVDGETVFYGFVFIKKRSKDGTIAVTAYDQTRYLKNKDTFADEGLSASDLVRRLAEDFQLRLGAVEDTGFVLDTVVEENATLFDMIQNALNQTLLQTGRLYVLYDDAGALTLKNIQSMKVPVLIDAEAGENFDYESGIDSRTHNKIKLTFNNEKTGKREVYVAQDGESINRWGVLQYYEQLQTETGAAAKARNLLKLYNGKTRRLTVKQAFGDIRVRAGCALPVSLDLGDIITNQFLVVDRVTHTFKGGEHMMDLTLIGGEFIA